MISNDPPLQPPPFRRSAKIAMRGYRDGVVLEGPWRPVRARRVNWSMVGALFFGALWIFIFGVTVGVMLS